jgi:hypothetical protein
MRTVALGPRTNARLVVTLAAFALWGCSVEGASPPPSSSPPGREPLGAGGACPALPSECQGDRCCQDPNDCSHKTCTGDNEVCKNNECVPRPLSCDSGSQCVDAGGADASDGFVCSEENICVATHCRDTYPTVLCGPGQVCLNRECVCTSNRGCDIGQACQEVNNVGTCVSAIEDESNPGCSASGADRTSGLVLISLSALALAGGARARRRRSE